MVSWFYGVLLVILIGFMIVPFIPAVSEYFRRRDKGPRRILDTTIIDEAEDLEESSASDLPYIEQSRVDARVKTIGDFVRVVGDVSIPDETEVNSPIVIHGNLSLGAHCKIHGTIKATKNLNIGEHNIIMGHCISGGNVEVGPHTRVEGIVDAVGDIIIRENAFVGGASAEKSIKIRPGATVAKKLSADQLVMFEPISTEVEVPRAEKELVTVGEDKGEKISVEVDSDIYALDQQFSKGEMNLETYLQKRQALIEQRSTELNRDSEILKLLSERKKVMEISLRLLMDPEKVNERVNNLITEGFINADFSLTEKGVKKLFG